MLDALVESEGEPDLVQLSGGEPTIHPDFFAILDAVKRRPIRHVMINTNGVRIAQDREFVERLASYAPRLEVYLQFDSMNDEARRAAWRATVAHPPTGARGAGANGHCDYSRRRDQTRR